MLLRKFFTAFIFVAAMMSFSPVNASTIKPHGLSFSIGINNDSLKAVQMQQRLNEIQSMDLQNLSATEKKNLRKELLTMKKDASHLPLPGIYISGGALIIIIIVLLIVLK